MLDTFKYLVLSGGGPNGFLHIGALQFIERCLHQTTGQSIRGHFLGFAGTSVGALLAFCLAIGLNTTLIQSTLQRLLPQILTVEMSLFALHETHGLWKPSGLQNLIEEVLLMQYHRSDLTFQELAHLTGQRQLSICACNTTTNQIEVFNAETFPDTSVKDAILASMAIPVIYPPVLLQQQLYIDGGCQCNLPLGVYPLTHTLALWIVEPAQTRSPDKPIREARNFTTQVIKTFLYANDAFIHHCFYPAFRAHFIRMPSFTHGFLPLPQRSTTGAVRRGALYAGKHMLDSCPTTPVLFWLILEHFHLYTPRRFISWALSQLIYGSLTDQLISDGSRQSPHVASATSAA